MLRGPQLVGKKLTRATNYEIGSENKLNISEIKILSIFEMFAERTNASVGPHVARGPHV